MTRRAVLGSSAARDVDRILDRFAQDNLDAALRFLDSISAACDLLGRHPHAGHELEPPFQSLPGLRVWALPEFRSILVFYIPDSPAARVVRVLHGARDLRTVLESESGSI